MLIRFKSCWILAAVLFLQPLCALGQQEDTKPVPLPDGMIEFKSFYKQDWRTIIEDYAEIAGLSLQIVENPPTGTFDYEGDQVMTIQEGLDFLNQMLIPRDRVLIRNRDLLLLFDITKGIPDDLIETVSPAELAERGRYEIMKCRFDISGLDGEGLRNEVEQLVDDAHRREIALIPSANQLIIQEQGHRLREINNILIDAKKMWGLSNFAVESIELEHIAPEDLFAHVSLLGVNRDTLSNEDGTLNLSWNPLDTVVLVTGLPEKIAQLKKLVVELDKPRDANAAALEPPFYAAYRVDGDAAQMHEVLQTMVAGRDVNLDVDEDANKIHFRGRTPDHELVMEIINKAQGSSDELAVFWIKEKDVDDIIDTIEKLFRLDDDEAAADGPLLAAETQNRLIARGTPNQIATIRRMVTEIDVPYQRDSSARLPNRLIPLNGPERSSTMNLLETMIPTMGLNNDIRVMMPEDRLFILNSNSEIWRVYGADRREQSTDDPSMSDPRLLDPPPQDPRLNDPRSEPRMSAPANREAPRAETAGDRTREAAPPIPAANQLQKTPSFKGHKGSYLQRSTPRQQPAFLPAAHTTVSMISLAPPQQEEDEDNGSGRTSREQPPQEETRPEIQSIPGAPVTIRVTDLGLVLQSDDLEALDAIEDVIMQHLDSSAGAEEFALFYLKYRDAIQAKQMLEKYLGISGGSGGGGGALSGLMGGMLRNTVGEAAGGLVDTFMGGSGSSSDAGIFITRGPVAIVADVQKYTLMISAVPEDMEVITRLVNLIDQPDAIQQPNSIGDTYTIDILYRDPMEIADMVRESLGPLLRQAEGQGGEQGNAQGRAEQQFIQALMGRRGGGGGEDQEELPKASLAVDTKNDRLVVTGPRFIYDQILAFVVKVDQPNNLEMVELQGRMDPHLLTELVQLMADDSIEIIIDDEEGDTGAQVPGTGGQSNNRGGAQNNAQAMQNMARFQQAIQRAQQQQQRQQQGGRGGGGQGGRGDGGGQGGRPGGGSQPRGGGR